MATFIDGIAASQNIDSSGERISVAGMDISSLDLDGVFTYEHEAATGPNGEKITIKLPAQTVGKILKAKKIFSEEDCEDERHTYFWQKCQTPFVYVMGELFDDYTEAAKDLAGKLRYDADHKNQNERSVMNFSIEGSYIAREGIEVTRSVARKCTITVMPCNKAAVAEIVPAKGSSNANDIDSLFKTETIEIELFKTEPVTFKKMKSDMADLHKHAEALGLEPMSKNVVPFKKPLTTSPSTAVKQAPSASAGDSAKIPSSTTNAGKHIGSTQSGKSVFSHAKIHEYHGFSSSDHAQAASLHHKAAQASTDHKTSNHHLDKMKIHLQAGKTAELKETRFARAKSQKIANLGKTLEAGSGMAAPGQLTQGAALAKEDLAKVAVPGSKYPPKALAPAKPSYTVGGVPKWAPIAPKAPSPLGKSETEKPIAERHPSEMKPGSQHNIGLKSGHLATYHRSTPAAHHFTSENGTKTHQVKRNVTLGKSELYARAEEEYANWDKKEEFRSFMKSRMPHLAEGEVDAIGRTVALKKSIDAEKNLSKLIKK